MKASHVLFFYQHFWPDSPPYATMLRSIGKRLADAGVTVSMITGQPSYKPVDFDRRVASAETLDGISVQRLSNLPAAHAVRPIALIGKVLFPVRALLIVVARKLQGKQPDVIVAATIPPVFNGACGLLAARLTGAKFVYHMQDIYPEIGAVGGLWSRRSLRYKALAFLDSLISRRADVCVVLSGDMQRALVARGVDAASIHIINNFMLESFVDNQFSATQTSISQSDATQITPTINLSVRPANAPFRVVFAGNLGRFQALDALLGAFLDERSQQLPLELHFLGDGVSKAELVTMADGNPSVHFHGHVPFDQAARFMQECDAGIVSIAPGIIHYAYPSKTLSYLGLGVPLFALVEQSSELAIEIDQQNLGIVCQGSSHEALVNGYSRLARWLEQEIDIQVRIEAYARLSSSPKAAADKWKTLLKNIA